VGLASTALVVLEISIDAEARAGYGPGICRTVDEERREVSNGRDLHCWIEGTLGSMNGATSDVKALTPVDV
jgi:hypothetical protein